MAGRYTDWHGTRLVGDRALAAQYLAAGRKLLGQLAHARTLGSRQAKWQVTTPEGAVLTAEMIGQQPRLTIDVRAVAGERERAALEGFVVTPGGPHAAGVFPEVVLQPKKGADTWRVEFYDSTTVPLAYPRAHGLYKPLFRDGLVYAGAVDWRNADETLSVSWDGPNTRYFSDGSAGSSLVYFKNAVAFDALPVLAPLGLASDSVEVRGACLVGGGLRLLVVLLRTVGSSQFDTVLSVPLAMQPATTPPARTPRVHAAVTVPTTAIDILLDRVLPGDENDLAHPWCFNQAGTEARCMRPDGNAFMRELVLTIAADRQSATVTRTSEAWPTVTTTDSVSRTLRALRLVGTYAAARVASGGTSVESLAGALSAYRGLAVSLPADEEYELDYVVAQTRTTTVTGSGKLRIAVDYRNNVPVYAFALPPDTSESYSFSSTRSGSYADSVATTTSGTDLRLASLSTSGTHDEVSSDSSSTTKSGRTAGIETDWGTITATVSVTASTAHSYTWHDTWSSGLTFTTPVVAPWGVWGTDFRGFGSTRAQTSSQTNSSTTTEAGLLTLHHLDLRYRWASYTWQQIVTTTGATGGIDWADAGVALDEGTASGLVHSWSGPAGDAGYVDSTLGIRYGAPNNTPASPSDPGNTACSSTKASSFDRTEDYRLRITLGGLLVEEVPVHTASTHTTSADANVVPYRRYGDVLRATTDGTARRDGRTVSALFATDPSTDVPDTVGSGSTSAAQSGFSADRLTPPSSWQTYGDHYAYAVVADPLSTGPVYAHGLGRFTDLAILPSLFTLPELTGSTPSPARFAPISILPPTARP